MNTDRTYKLAFTSRDCLDLIKEKILYAKKSIDIETFYFLEDTVGTDLLHILMDKAKNGVSIRIMLDHVGSYGMSKSNMLDDLKHAGIKIRFFNSIIPFSKNRKTFWYLRNHRRTIIIDNEEVFTGSMCFGEPTQNWLETGIFVKDKELALKVTTVFNKTWSKVYHPTFSIGSTLKNSLYDLYDFNYVTQSPLQFRRNIYKYYLDSIKNARESIYLVSPYLVPTMRLMKSLIQASKRQVRVVLILPKKTDWTIVDLARNTFIRRLLRNGVQVYFHEDMVHSKYAIFDRREAFVGTFNLDNLSMVYNYECGLKITNKECVQELTTYTIEKLLPKSTKLDLETWEHRGFLLKFVEKIVKLFREFL